MVETTTDYNYNSPNHLKLASQIKNNSKGEPIKSEYTYVSDILNSEEPFIKDLNNKNIIAKPVQTKTFNGSVQLSEQKTKYGTFGSLILPKSIYNKKGSGISEQDKKITYDSYDIKGNLTQYTTEGGISVFIIWGYDKQYPIAKIENATLATVAAKLGLTEAAVLNLNETNLATINTLRTHLPEAQISTYTYQPLVGITSMTDPKAYTIYYEYDASNRLKLVRDANHNILSENEYHYKD